MGDDFDLGRFVAAPDAGGTDETAPAELRRGRKTSHWIWFVFPQIAGLGSSPTSRRYAISGLEEARAYLRHPVLGPRLEEAARTLLAHPGTDAAEILGALDAKKVWSSMTLFHRADPAGELFGQVLTQYFGGGEDPATDDRLLPDPGAGRADPDDVRVVIGEAGRGPAVPVDERLVLGQGGRDVLGPGAGGGGAGLPLEDHVVAALAVAFQVQRDLRVGLDASVLRPLGRPVDQELPVGPQEPHRGGLGLAGRGDRGQPDDRLRFQPLWAAACLGLLSSRMVMKSPASRVGRPAGCR